MNIKEKFENWVSK